ncbi:MAG: MerR family DNA-binding transcriptional regulator, partial [Rhodococcus sp. (in: high G+C Gram-positive bacteria)]
MPHTPGFPAIPGLYGISVTAELSGFTIATLRLYEQHGLITPARTRGGTRRYSARVALPSSHTSWEKYVEDYDRIRDTMSKAHDGFEDFNRRVRLPLGFRIRQPARELIFLTPSGRAEFSAAPLPDETT